MLNKNPQARPDARTLVNALHALTHRAATARTPAVQPRYRPCCHAGIWHHLSSCFC